MSSKLGKSNEQLAPEERKPLYCKSEFSAYMDGSYHIRLGFLFI
ncbi:hypothetical protein J32TS6_06490 [Virgibacillus pantothenticus]|nr:MULTISPECIES: hypothetical protein [Virgibacillus]MEB5452213.1 hypothetical protein [Virgibacillus pantothenticus]MEB5456223.1 hypothetical protein [Virgibacillus pantothenticus]MEB5460336.1 hypothetical protein [Virgibacillus pantothenticus]MEB5464707.1 hypothetical protein [Virgibacillus pantothenticus]MEB5469063.1 hypothetical protein [Virgibacillus pantothenticus]